jgi:hypothetical protein
MENRCVKTPLTRPGSQASEDASRLAIAALGFLASDPERLEKFLALSGLGPHNLRAAATDDGFLASVLDYVAGDEGLLVAFASHQQRRPDEIMRARDALGGGPPHEA